MFTKNEFKSFVGRIFGSGYITGQGKDLQVICPVCKALKGHTYSKRKLSISLMKNSQGLCYCWVCSYKSKNLLHLIKKYRPQYLVEYKENFLNTERIGIEDEEKEEIKIVTLPTDFQLLATVDNADAYANRARNYLKARGISLKSDVWYWKFGISMQKNVYNRIIVPSFDKEGNLNYFSARLMEDGNRFKTKYYNPEASERENIIFNELNINWNEELTIVEGVFDLIKSNPNATCLLGSDLSANYRLFDEITRNKTPVVLALDPGARKKEIEIANRLHEFGISVRVLNLASNNNKKDVGNMLKNEFIEHLNGAKLYSIDYALRSKIATII